MQFIVAVRGWGIELRFPVRLLVTPGSLARAWGTESSVRVEYRCQMSVALGGSLHTFACPKEMKVRWPLAVCEISKTNFV